MNIGGYLVVLDQHFIDSSYNREYRGINRIPPYPSDVIGETEALDAYVFGEYTDENGFISSLDKAEELLAMFSASPRKYEIIYCRAAEKNNVDKNDEWLGFDVASEGSEFWSIVRDFPKRDGFRDFRRDLNSSGLFLHYENAISFLERYREEHLPDHDSRFLVFSVGLMYPMGMGKIRRL